MCIVVSFQTGSDGSFKPSCKTSGKAFSYSSATTSKQALYRVFGLVEEKKKWKMKKIPVEDFEERLEGISASVSWLVMSVRERHTRLTHRNKYAMVVWISLVRR